MADPVTDVSAVPAGMEVFAVSLCSSSRTVIKPCTAVSVAMANLNTDVNKMIPDPGALPVPVTGLPFTAKHGTYLAFNVVRDQACAHSADLIFTLYGRKWNGDQTAHYTTMFNLAATPSISTTVTTDDTNDAMTKNASADGVVKRRSSDTNAQTYDKRGFDEFLIRVTTAYASTGGSSAAADAPELVVREF